MDAKEFKRGDIERLRDEAQNCAGAGVKWMTITERPEAIAELAKIALAALSDAAQAPEPDCWAILTPNGSRLVSPEEAKGRRDAYPLYAAPIAADAAAPGEGRADCGETLPGVFTNADDLIAALNLPDERAAPTDSIPLHEDMLRALEHVECVYRQNVVKDGEPSSTLANLQRVIARARATAPQATVKGDERMGLTFEEWASDPVRAYKIPLDKHPNGAYSDTRSYLIAFGWKSALKHGAAVPQAGATLTEEVIAEAVKKWFPDRSYQASFFARALLSPQAEK